MHVRRATPLVSARTRAGEAERRFAETFHLLNYMREENAAPSRCQPLPLASQPCRYVGRGRLQKALSGMTASTLPRVRENSSNHDSYNHRKDEHAKLTRFRRDDVDARCLWRLRHVLRVRMFGCCS